MEELADDLQRVAEGPAGPPVRCRALEALFWFQVTPRAIFDALNCNRGSNVDSTAQQGPYKSSCSATCAAIWIASTDHAILAAA